MRCHLPPISLSPDSPVTCNAVSGRPPLSDRMTCPPPPRAAASRRLEAWRGDTAGPTPRHRESRRRKEFARPQESPYLSIRRDSRIHPTFRGAHGQSEPRGKGSERAPEFPPPPPCEFSSSRTLPESNARVSR